MGEVGLERYAKRQIAELSGGEQQRVALARAIANNPDIIIADEPTGNIDPEMSIEIMNLLMKINQILGKTVIVVTHEMDLVERFGHRVITLDGGKLVCENDKLMLYKLKGLTSEHCANAEEGFGWIEGEWIEVLRERKGNARYHDLCHVRS